jgi:hypothetical protein
MKTFSFWAKQKCSVWPSLFDFRRPGGGSRKIEEWEGKSKNEEKGKARESREITFWAFPIVKSGWHPRCNLP